MCHPLKLALKSFCSMALATLILFPSFVAAQDSVETSSSPKLTKGSTTFKIVNWNVLYGFNHSKSVEAGAEWLDEQKPDVVALQELNGVTSDGLKKLATQWQHSHSVILKETGFPVGLTSAQPISVIKRQVDGFHHGYLHCVTQQIHFFVVHFWPGKDHEGKQVSDEVHALIQSGEKVIVLGDFNSHSHRDLEFLSTKPRVKPQYNVVELFESVGMVDLVAKHSPNQKYSFPSPITIPRWSKDKTVLNEKRQRIDFVFAGPRLGKKSIEGKIIASPVIESISDHYPVIAEIRQSK